VLEFLGAKAIPPFSSAGYPQPAPRGLLLFSASFLGNAGFPAKEKPVFYVG
jgi:hypothetical protein